MRWGAERTRVDAARVRWTVGARAVAARCLTSLLVAASTLLAGCRSSPRIDGRESAAAGATTSVPPALLLGEFVDDYDNRFTITPTMWTQLPHGRFNVIRWNAGGQYLIARNDSADRSAPGRWTRIDWVLLPNMAPYEWAFCLSAYDAPTVAAAESTTVARRDTPRTGCNGFPFSRMRRL